MEISGMTEEKFIDEKMFDQIVNLDNRAIQDVLREIDDHELAKALKPVHSAVSDKIFGNMSKRASIRLKEDMKYMGPVRLIDVTKAQIKFFETIYALASTGEITIPNFFRFPENFKPFNHKRYKNNVSTIPPAKDIKDLGFIEAFYSIYERALGFSQMAKLNGILALEDIIDSEKVANRDIFEYGIHMFVDKIDRETIDKILSNIVAQEKDESLQLLKTIQKEAVLMIHAGENQRALALVLKSYTDISLIDITYQDMEHGELT
jgi:hypothetical protein